MKKIFSIVLIIAAFVIAAGCSTMSQVTNDPYSAEGTGIALNNDIAYNKAFMEACTKLAQKYNFTVDYTVSQAYDSKETGRGKADEYLAHSQDTKGKAKVNASDIVVTKCKYGFARGNKVSCTMVVKVSPDNLQ